MVWLQYSVTSLAGNYDISELLGTGFFGFDVNSN